MDVWRRASQLLSATLPVCRSPVKRHLLPHLGYSASAFGSPAPTESQAGSRHSRSCVVNRHGQTVSADNDRSEELSHQIVGASRQNEQGVLTVCGQRVEHLRNFGLAVGAALPVGTER